MFVESWYPFVVKLLIWNGKLRNFSYNLKTRVLIWFCWRIYDEGHEVIGVDGVEKPILDFFKEQSLEYVKEIDQHGIVTFSVSFNFSSFDSSFDRIIFLQWQTKDGRLKIYNCDLCDLDPTICGTFDGIWDRRSLTAIPPTDRNK